MATSLDKLQNKFRGGAGQLGEASSEEVGALASASGLPVQPTSPLAGAGLGASPASAAMLGSSANQRSALRTAIQGSMSQATSERQNAAVVSDKEAQAKKAEDATKLGQFAGALDTRVQQLVQQKIAAATTGGANAQTGLKVDPSAVQSVAPENAAEMEALLTKLGSNTASNADIARINALMGKTEIGTQLDANTLKSKFLTGSAQIGQALASGLADSLKVVDADVASLGIGSKSDIAALLGVDEQELDAMSVSELLGDIADEQQKQFTTTKSMQLSAASPLLGQAERAAARQALRGASVSGVLSAEDSIADIQQQLDEANTVKFAGEDVSVENLLTDEYLSGIVKSYLDDPTGPVGADLAKNNPDLKDWIETNKAGLDKLAAGIDKETTDFANLQYENQKLKTPEGAGTIDDKAMKALIPDWGQLRGEAYTKAPLFDVISNTNIDAGIRSNLVNGINRLSSFDSSRVSELAGMNYNNLISLGLDKAENMQRYIDNAQAARSMEVAPTSSPAAFLSTLGVVDPQRFTEDAKKTRLYTSLGIGGSDSTELLDILDPDGDGLIQPDHLAQAKVQFANLFRDQKLSDLLASGRSTADLPTMASLASALKPKLNNVLSPLVRSQFEDSIADGEMSSADAYSIFSADKLGNLNNLKTLEDKFRSSSFVKGDAADGIRKAGEELGMQRVLSNLDEVRDNGGFDALKDLQDRVMAGKEELSNAKVEALYGTLHNLKVTPSDNPYQTEARGKVQSALESVLAWDTRRKVEKAQAEEAKRKAEEAKRRADAIKSAQAAWDKVYGNYQQNKDGQWGIIYNGMWNRKDPPPPRPQG